jgi:hypothetical protein
MYNYCMTPLELSDINLTLLVVIAVWELIWKGFALWIAARNNSKVWFILILVLNTVGVLPIIYLLLNYTKKRNAN